MPDPVRRIQHSGPFPIRRVVGVLMSLADDFDRMLGGGRVLLLQRVRWIKASEANAEALLYACYILLNQADYTPTKLRALAVDYQRVMTTRRTPVRPGFTTGARQAPPLPQRPMFHVKPPVSNPGDQG